MGEPAAAKAAIAEVIVRYATGIDRRDWDAFRSCFTVDCRAEYEGIADWDGVEAIVEFMVAAHAGMGHTLHRMSNIAIDVDTEGRTATAHTYVDAVLMTADGGTGINALGFYDDRFVETADGWRIAHRRFTPVRTAMLP